MESVAMNCHEEEVSGTGPKNHIPIERKSCSIFFHNLLRTLRSLLSLLRLES
jgi:hypothetical protein